MSRPRKPSMLKVVGGTARKDRMNGGEPEPILLNDLEPPAHLMERSAVVWRELAPMLRRNQVLTEADVLALSLLCDAVADYRLAREQGGEKFTTYSSNGSKMLDPMLLAQQMLCKRAEGLLGKFGMDPASRSRVIVNPQGDLFGAPAAATGSERFFK